MSEETKKKSRADQSIEAVTELLRSLGLPDPIPCEGHGSITILRPNKSNEKKTK